MREVQTFPTARCYSSTGFEGVVSKRLNARSVSGPSRNWVKTKCPEWKRINAERHRLFERPRKPGQTGRQRALVKKREKLARVLERLRASGLSASIARELRKQRAILEREVAELEQA
jgi:hypothetical protein